MKNSLKTKFVAASLAIAIMAIPSITVFASYKDYTSYALPPRQGNNYTGSHQKATADQFINNKVTSLTHTDTATFWATNGVEDQISNDYDQKVGNESKIQFRNHVDKSADVKMGMQNKSWNIVQNGFVIGQVDFR